MHIGKVALAAVVGAVAVKLFEKPLDLLLSKMKGAGQQAANAVATDTKSGTKAPERD